MLIIFPNFHSPSFAQLLGFTSYYFSSSCRMFLFFFFFQFSLQKLEVWFFFGRIAMPLSKNSGFFFVFLWLYATEMINYKVLPYRSFSQWLISYLVMCLNLDFGICYSFESSWISSVCKLRLSLLFDALHCLLMLCNVLK